MRKLVSEEFKQKNGILLETKHSNVPVWEHTRIAEIIIALLLVNYKCPHVIINLHFLNLFEFLMIVS